MRRSLLSLALSCAVLFCSFSSFADGKNNPLQAFIDREKAQHEFVPVTALWQVSDRFPVAATEPFAKDVKVMDIDAAQLSMLATEKPQAITLTVANPKGGSYEVELARFDFLSKDFKIQLNEANGVKKMVDYTPGAYYRGVVKGVEGSMAAFCFFGNEAYGTLSTPADGNIVIEPNTLTGAPAGNYLLYADRDMKIRPQGKCGTDDRLEEFKKVPAQNKNVYGTCKDVEVYFLADNATYISFGQNITTLGNYITSVFNVTTALYRNEGVYVSIRYMEVNGAADVYGMLSNSSPDFLFTFADQLSNAEINLHGADMGMLLSTKYNSTMGGIALLGMLCGNMPASFSNINKAAPGNFPTYTWNSHMITHEFGHTLGSPHTHACEWNGNFSAIDACTALEGSCPTPVPAFPTGGGTIMSYCHFQSVGVNFSKGFGTQPGDLIRNNVFTAPCAEIRTVTQPTADNNKVLVANRECTDDNNITWYWNDNNNVEESDDVLALKIRKAGSNIGTLDVTGFEVKTGTGVNYGTNKGDILTVPVGTALKGTNVSMTRYWNIKATTQPGGEVEVMFPFMATDMADIDGSVPNTNPLTFANLMAYMTINGKNSNMQGATASDIKTYTNAISSSSTTWSAEQYGDTILAKFNTAQLNGGGSIIYSYSVDPTTVQSIFTKDKATFYPNPTHNSWNVWVPKNGDNIRFVLYTVDGRIVKEQTLQGNAVNEVDATTLAAGLYYYRISSETATYTGNLQKN